MDALCFGRGREPWVDHHVVDCVSRLGNDHLQVHWRLVPVGNSKGPGAVRVHRVGARIRGPARRNVAVNGNRVELSQIALPSNLVLAAINEQRRTVREENLPVDGKGVGALNGGIAASAGVGHQG